MSKNIKLNNKEYSGISTVQLPTTDGGTASFKDTDEIVTPSGTKTITANGTFDVANFAQAFVNVAGGTGGLTIHTGEQVISNGNTQKSINHNLNLSSYICIYWDANMEEFMQGTSSDSRIVSGIGAYNYDFGDQSTVGQSFTDFRISKTYTPSTSSWDQGNISKKSTDAAERSTENVFYMNTTGILRVTTYKWIIIDLSNLSMGE